MQSITNKFVCIFHSIDFMHNDLSIARKQFANFQKCNRQLNPFTDKNYSHEKEQVHRRPIEIQIDKNTDS